MSLAMTKQERETFLADLHVGIISIPEEGRGPLAVPIWYLYEPGGELRVLTPRTSRKAQLLQHASRFVYVYRRRRHRTSTSVSRNRLSRSSQQILSVIAGPSLTVTTARKGVTGTSRRHGENTSGTCLFACCRNDGSPWTTRRHRAAMTVRPTSRFSNPGLALLAPAAERRR